MFLNGVSAERTGVWSATFWFTEVNWDTYKSVWWWGGLIGVFTIFHYVYLRWNCYLDHLPYDMYAVQYYSGIWACVQDGGCIGESRSHGHRHSKGQLYRITLGLSHSTLCERNPCMWFLACALRESIFIQPEVVVVWRSPPISHGRNSRVTLALTTVPSSTIVAVQSDCRVVWNVISICGYVIV